MTDPSSTYRRVFTAGVTILIAALALVALSKNYLTNIDITEANRSADIYLLSSSHPWPCNEIMIGVWTKTCLVQTQGMISYNFVSLGDGSFAELQSDGLGFMSMYGTYIYTPGEVASSSQNCLADYTSHFKQEPLDRWRPAQGSLDYNTWYFGKDFFTNEPNSVSCRFERIKGQECRNRISRLLFHFANDGVALSQYQNAPEDLC
ncbi:hypothetical protein ACA910_003020 [Epithemia clementina (nom. ined.)]